MPELKNRRQELFCRSYFLEPIGAKAVIKAGYKAAHADECQRRLLRMSHIQARLSELRAPGDAAFQGQVAAVMRRLWDMATVDMRELVQLHVGPCRYCHGIGHQYQWKSEREYKVALALALKGLRPNTDVPDPSIDPSWPSLIGGTGYRLTREANPNCPECDGLGEPYVTATPSSDLTDRQASLYSGAKRTAHGIEVVTKDQIKALALLAQSFRLDEEQSPRNGDKLTAGLAEICARMASAAPLRAQYAEDETR